jgi:hypothetical protein
LTAFVRVAYNAGMPSDNLDDQVARLVRCIKIADTDEAIKLLHAALAVAKHDGIGVGLDQAREIIRAPAP